jgi:hypothetical protein
MLARSAYVLAVAAASIASQPRSAFAQTVTLPPIDVITSPMAEAQPASGRTDLSTAASALPATFSVAPRAHAH